MSIKEYKYTKFTDKDMFEMRLAGTIPDFGFIAPLNYKDFFEFCVANGFIKKFSETSNRKATVYYVLITFRFDAMFNYKPKPVIFAAGISSAIVYTDFRMINTGPK